MHAARVEHRQIGTMATPVLDVLWNIVSLVVCATPSLRNACMHLFRNAHGLSVCLLAAALSHHACSIAWVGRPLSPKHVADSTLAVINGIDLFLIGHDTSPCARSLHCSWCRS